ILMVRRGKVATPPAWEGALESITVDILEALCGELGIDFERRPIDRSELLVAEEIGLAGTLAELTEVRSLDGQALPGARTIRALQQRYLDAVTGRKPHQAAAPSCRRVAEVTAFELAAAGAS